MELKKPTTYEEQVSLLIEKGIVINDYDDCKALPGSSNDSDKHINLHTQLCFTKACFSKIFFRC